MNADLWLPLSAGLVGLALGVPLTGLSARMLRAPRDFAWRVRLAASLATGALFVLLALGFGFAAELPAYLLLAAASVTLSIVDVAEKRLPNPLLLATTVIVAVALVIAAGVGTDWGAALGALLGGAALFAVYLVLALISPAGIGMGDVKLAAVIGLALGYLGWDTWLIGLVAGFLVGSAISLVALALRRVSLRGSLPFGPSMLAGAYIAILVAVL